MLHFCAESAVKLQPTLPGWLLQCHLVLQQGKWGGGAAAHLDLSLLYQM